MKTINTNRRIFLKNMLAASVLTATCPHILLGNIQPEIYKSDTTVSGVYSLDLDQFPMLKEIWGSVRLNIPKLNDEKPAEVIVTRLPFDEYGQHFAVVNTICPHEGNKVNDLHPDLHIFDCPGHGTMFEVTGKYISGYAPQGLQNYLIDKKWTPEDRYLKILFDFDVASIIDSNINSPLFYLKNNYPNPFSDFTTIEYGVDKDSIVKIEILDISSKSIETIFDGALAVGTYHYRFNGDNIPSGIYITKLSINGIDKKIIKMIKK